MPERPVIAVFGGKGQLGCALGRRAREHGVACHSLEGLDVRQPLQVKAALLDLKPRVTINAAAYTAVDKAESEPELAHQVNCEGAKAIAEAAVQIGCGLIHISTDYVFDGTKNGRYTEEDPVRPMSVYGRTKAEGETAVLKAHAGAVIVRASWVYGLEGSNFVRTMLRLGENHDEVRVVDDQRGAPTFADDLADALLLISSRVAAPNMDFHGIYHLTGTGEATWCEFARAIFAIVRDHGGKNVRVTAIGTQDYPTAARRPANSVLDCTKAERVFGVRLPHWRDGLGRMLGMYLAPFEATR